MNKKPDSVDKHIGTMLRTLRRARGWSQGDLAKTLGISYQQLQKYEKGENRLPAAYLYHIAETLGTPAWTLFPPSKTRQ